MGWNIMAGDINFTWNRDTWRPWECRNANNRHLIAKKREEIVCTGPYTAGSDLCVLQGALQIGR